MPSFKLANSLYDQSFSEVLAFKDAEPDATTLRKYLNTIFLTYDNISQYNIVLQKHWSVFDVDMRILCQR